MSVFELFDPKSEFVISEGGHLPHWYQPGVTYFVTFRTADSLPLSVARQWHWRREDWLVRHGIQLAGGDVDAGLRSLTQAKQREFHEVFSDEYLAHLDRGHGACHLRSPCLARVVAESLLHFDGERYHMGAFVIMPNHVHLLARMLHDTEIQEQCESWKRFTARGINRQLGRSGRFWQEESFDHLVRTPEQFEAIREYIQTNPQKAKLRKDEYLFWKRQDS